jgi:hypothetical protein
MGNRQVSGRKKVGERNMKRLKTETEKEIGQVVLFKQEAGSNTAKGKMVRQKESDI